MAPVTLHFIHRFKCGTQAQHQIDCADIAKIGRCQCSQEQQAYICWRCTMGNEAAWMFLKVIRGQPVIFGANEPLVKEPGSAGQAAQLTVLVFRQGDLSASSYLTNAVNDQGRCQPEKKQR